MEAKRTAYYVNAYAVGKLGRGGPVVLLGQAFGISVFAAQKPVRRLRGRPDELARHVDGHHREHLCAVVHLLEYAFRARHHEVCRTHNARFLQARYAVGVHKAAVKHGYRHAPATVAAVVQLLSANHFGLSERHPVRALLHGVPAVELRVIPRTGRSGVDGVGRRPHLAHRLDATEQRNALQFRQMAAAHEHGVVPFAAAHHINPHGTDFVHVSRIDGKVGRVEPQVLAVAPLQGLCRKEVAGPREAVRRAALVFQFDAEHVCPASRIFHLERILTRPRANDSGEGKQ